MAVDRRHLLQHLAQAAHAFGHDLQLPAGKLAPRSPAATTRLVEAPVAEVILAEAILAEAILAEATTPESTAADPEPPPTGPIVVADAGPRATAAAAPTASADRKAAMQQLRQEASQCTRCRLHEGRQHVVFGEGNLMARVFFVGEAPGAVEDQTGRPFVGPAGQLLDRILAGAMGLQRSEVFIANINKCRPPGNREPEPDEVAACMPYLARQIALVQPEVIVCLGRTAAQNLLGSTESTTALRARQHDYHGIPVVVTWHPAYLLRDPSHKRETWDDIKRVNRLLGLPDVPPPPSA